MNSTNGYKRTPNCECIVCKKPLYRRPFELKKVRHVACMKHRAEAQKLSGITEKQYAALSLGRGKGINHLTGIPKSEASKRKRSDKMKQWAIDNPDIVKARGEKTRGKNHYNWKGGSTRLNVSIRHMNEHRKWMDAVKEKDNYACVLCGSVDEIESHHKIPLATIVAENNIKNRTDARNCIELWDVENGQTLCRKCHYIAHGRKYDN